MTIGEKIKQSRKEKNITQSELCGDKITRNMLSEIENNKALPSLQTLLFIAERLEIPSSYLISESDDLFFYKKQELIKEIKTALSNNKYESCVEMVSSLGNLDDELCFILTVCHFEIAQEAMKGGSFETAKNNFELCESFALQTVYDTSKYTHRLPLYLSVCKNATAPLLEFEENSFLDALSEVCDLDFYKYLILDLQFDFRNPMFKKHITAKQHIKDRKYLDAISLLKEIENEKAKKNSGAYFIFCVYGDLEICYRQISDFENAYRYSSKRMSMLEGFKS